MIPDFPHNIRIRLAQLKNWASQQGRNLATSGGNKKQFLFFHSYSYILINFCYHKFLIQNNLGFIVSDLTYTLKSLIDNHSLLAFSDFFFHTALRFLASSSIKFKSFFLPAGLFHPTHLFRPAHLSLLFQKQINALTCLFLPITKFTGKWDCWVKKAEFSDFKGWKVNLKVR
jgi:hypothetical protein